MKTERIADILTKYKDEVSVVRKSRLLQIEEKIQTLAEHQVRLEYCTSTDSYSVLELAYSIPKRAHDIISAMRLGILNDQVVPVVILARALVETTATGCLFYDRMEKHLTNTDHERLAKDFIKFYAGGRLAGSTKGFHTNDGLRHLEEIDLTYFESISQASSQMMELLRDKAGVLKLYDELSEIAHPNGLGLQYLYPAEDAADPKRVKERYRHLVGAAVWQCHHIVRAMESFSNFDLRFNDAFPEPPGFRKAMSDAGLVPS